MSSLHYLSTHLKYIWKTKSNDIKQTMALLRTASIIKIARVEGDRRKLNSSYKCVWKTHTVYTIEQDNNYVTRGHLKSDWNISLNQVLISNNSQKKEQEVFFFLCISQKFGQTFFS